MVDIVGLRTFTYGKEKYQTYIFGYCKECKVEFKRKFIWDSEKVNDKYITKFRVRGVQND